MNKKQLLEHALEYGYKVRVVCQTATYDGFVVKCRDSDGISGFNMSNMTSYVYKNYNAVISVEPLEEVEKAENVYEYIERRIDEVSMGTISAESVKQVLAEAQERFIFTLNSVSVSAPKKVGGAGSVSEGDSEPDAPLGDQVWIYLFTPEGSVIYDVARSDVPLATAHSVEMRNILLGIPALVKAAKDMQTAIKYRAERDPNGEIRNPMHAAIYLIETLPNLQVTAHLRDVLKAMGVE